MKINYVIKGKGGIYSDPSFGPTFGSINFFNLCFQDIGTSLEGKNREDPYDENKNAFENNAKQEYIYEGKYSFKLKDFEVFQLYLS